MEISVAVAVVSEIRSVSVWLGDILGKFKTDRYLSSL